MKSILVLALLSVVIISGMGYAYGDSHGVPKDQPPEPETSSSGSDAPPPVAESEI